MKITTSALEKIKLIISTRSMFRITVIGGNDCGFHISISIENNLISKESVQNFNLIQVCSSPPVITDMESFCYLHDKQLDYNLIEEEFIVTTKL